MKLKSQLIISIIFFGIVLLLISASVVFTNQQVAQITNQEQTAGNIQTGSQHPCIYFECVLAEQTECSS